MMPMSFERITRTSIAGTLSLRVSAAMKPALPPPSTMSLLTMASAPEFARETCHYRDIDHNAARFELPHRESITLWQRLPAPRKLVGGSEAFHLKREGVLRWQARSGA